jgi:hypothetical protein
MDDKDDGLAGVREPLGDSPSGPSAGAARVPGPSPEDLAHDASADYAWRGGYYIWGDDCLIWVEPDGSWEVMEIVSILENQAP